MLDACHGPASAIFKLIAGLSNQPILKDARVVKVQLEIARAVALGASLIVCACDALSGEEEALKSCEVPSDCVLMQNTCCGICGPLGPADVTAVNVSAFDVQRRKVCGEGDVGCPGIACAQRSPTMLATCEAGRCAAVELAQHPATQCSTASQCRVRAVACCECGATTGPASLVAVSDEAAFTELLCNPVDSACRDCAPVYPSEATAACESSSCVVRDPRMF